MIVTDINPLVYAYRPELPLHQHATEALQRSRVEGSLLVLSEVAVGFLRVTTNRKFFAETGSVSRALSFVDAMAEGTRGVREASKGRWSSFQRITAEIGSAANNVHDALLAAACLDLDASILTADKGFLKYPGLRVHLLTPVGVVEHRSWA